MKVLWRERGSELVEGKLSPQEAWELLAASIGEKRISKDDVWVQYVVSTLCKWLDYRPLSLELMGRYLAENPALSLGEMLKRLQVQRLQSETNDCQEQLILDTAQLGLKAAFELSWRELDPMTQALGQLLSLFAPAVIPWKLVEMLSTTSPPLNWSSADLDRAKKQLCEWHLLKPIAKTKECYIIHPSIRGFLQAKLAASEKAEDFRRAFAGAIVPIALQIPTSPIRKDIEPVKDAIPHLEEVARTLTAQVRDNDLLVLFDRLGRLYQAQGLYAVAETWYARCLGVAQTRLGNDHPDVAATMNNLAGLYYAQGRFSKAEQLYVQALKLRKRLLGSASPDVATTLNNLAGLYYTQGRYSEAEPLYIQALELRKFLLGINHPDVATTLNNLALLYYALGLYEDAEPLYVRALELRKRLLGNDHPDVATTLNNLALLYYARGRYSEAEPLYVQAVELSDRVLGSNHLKSEMFRKNLAVFRAKTGANGSLVQMLKRKILPFVH